MTDLNLCLIAILCFWGIAFSLWRYQRNLIKIYLRKDKTVPFEEWFYIRNIGKAVCVNYALGALVLVGLVIVSSKRLWGM